MHASKAGKLVITNVERLSSRAKTDIALYNYAKYQW
jgi:hypothetical protein